MLFLEDERDDSYVNIVNKVIELDNDDAKYLEFVSRPVFTQMEYWNANYSMPALSTKLANKIKLHPMQFFVTHYTPLVERKTNIVNNLRNAGIDEYTFIETKDREALTPEELGKFTKITESERSLFLKHVEVFKMCNDDDYVVVFEDDAVFCDNLVRRLNVCLSQLETERWDALFSGECCGLHCSIENGKMVKETNGSRGTCMYVLNKGVGKRLYEIFERQELIHKPVDWWFGEIRPDNDFRYFWSEPTLVSQGSDTGLFQTSIVHTSL
jgi:glycosyl transferase family 25